jgi:hypothetical protein
MIALLKYSLIVLSLPVVVMASPGKPIDHEKKVLAGLQELVKGFAMGTYLDPIVNFDHSPASGPLNEMTKAYTATVAQPPSSAVAADFCKINLYLEKITLMPEQEIDYMAENETVTVNMRDRFIEISQPQPISSNNGINRFQVSVSTAGELFSTLKFGAFRKGTFSQMQPLEIQKGKAPSVSFDFNDQDQALMVAESLKKVSKSCIAWKLPKKRN